MSTGRGQGCRRDAASGAPNHGPGRLHEVSVRPRSLKPAGVHAFGVPMFGDIPGGPCSPCCPFQTWHLEPQLRTKGGEHPSLSLQRVPACPASASPKVRVGSAVGSVIYQKGEEVGRGGGRC